MSWRKQDSSETRSCSCAKAPSFNREGWTIFSRRPRNLLFPSLSTPSAVFSMKKTTTETWRSPRKRTRRTKHEPPVQAPLLFRLFLFAFVFFLSVLSVPLWFVCFRRGPAYVRHQSRLQEVHRAGDLGRGDRLPF